MVKACFKLHIQYTASGRPTPPPLSLCILFNLELIMPNSQGHFATCARTYTRTVFINSPLYRILRRWHKIIFWVCMVSSQVTSPFYGLVTVNHVYPDVHFVHMWTLKSTDVLWNDLLMQLDKEFDESALVLLKGLSGRLECMPWKWYHWINNDNRTSTAVCSTIFLFFNFQLIPKF